jgi:invasion protein IalB
MSEKPSALAGVANAFKGMPPAVQRIIVVLLILFAGALVGWIGRGTLTGAPASSDTVTVYKDWQVICPGNKAKDRNCELIQDVADSKSGRRMARVAIGQEKDKKEPTLVITTPLGVLIEPGVTLKLDSDQQKPYAFKTCVPDGCVAMAPFDSKLAGQFKDATDAALTVAAPPDGKTIDITFSTKGFAEAYRAYRNGEAKHNSWFWRLWL